MFGSTFSLPILKWIGFEDFGSENLFENFGSVLDDVVI